MINPSNTFQLSNQYRLPPQEYAFDSADSSSDSLSNEEEEVYEMDEIVVDVEEIENILSKKFSGFSGSLLKFGTLCAIAECEMKMFSN